MCWSFELCPQKHRLEPQASEWDLAGHRVMVDASIDNEVMLEYGEPHDRQNCGSHNGPCPGTRIHTFSCGHTSPSRRAPRKLGSALSPSRAHLSLRPSYSHLLCVVTAPRIPHAPVEA